MVGPGVQPRIATNHDGVPGRGMHAVDRPRLRARLDAATAARLILVAAPAGFGKSTLLAGWLAASGMRAAWIGLDDRDDDLGRFARSLAAAAGRLADRDETATRADPTQPFDADLALAAVLAPVAAAADGGADGAVLVLDDYHLIDDPAVHRFVMRLVERLPARARLVIATRADPPLPLARLRARGELVELRAEDLRFTPPEAAELFRSAAVELEPSEIEALTGRTEGWAAVLRLAAVSLQGRPDRAMLVRRFGASHRFVLDYVVEEVLSGLPADMQDFLECTSILGRLSGPLCDAITGGHDGQARLEELERANILTLPLDDERRWYRYHALFAEILRARLRSLRPERVPELHGRAAAWHAAEGNDEEAVAHVMRSDDPAAACRLVADASLRWLNAGEIRTVRRWLDDLPDDAVRGDPQLSASYAWCLVLPGETEGVAARLADAERALGTGRGGDALADATVRTQLALIRSRLADLEGDPQAAIGQARLARELLPPGLPPRGLSTLRGDATVLLARALASAGDTAGAAEAYEASLADLRAGGNLFATGRAVADLAGIAIANGDPAAAARRCEEEIARPPAESAASTSGAVWVALARARAELGQDELALAAARRGVEVGTRAGDAQVVRSALATLERVASRGERLPGGGPARLLTGPHGTVEALTPRELEVLRLIALGRSNARIASELFVTVGTVKSHAHAISGKLGAANRVEAVARARELGLVP